mgnify:CR=1 FL=1
MDNGTITVKLDDDLTAHSLTAGSSTVQRYGQSDRYRRSLY